MKKRIYAVLLGCLAAICLIGCGSGAGAGSEQNDGGPEEEDKEKNATYSVQFTDETDGNAVEGVSVSVIDEDGNLVAEDESSSKGKARFKLAEGSYQAVAKADGYEEASWEFTMEGERKTEEISLSAKESEDLVSAEESENPVSAEEAMAAYQTFLDGTGEVTLLEDREYYYGGYAGYDFRDKEPGFSTDKKWKLDNFVEFTIRPFYYEEAMGILGTLNMEYAYLDLGNDGVPELLVDITNYVEENLDLGYQTYCIIGWQDSEMRLLWIDKELSEYFMHTYKVILGFDYYGIVFSVWNYDMDISSVSISILGSDGKYHEIYSLDTYCNMGLVSLSSSNDPDSDLSEEFTNAYEELQPDSMEAKHYLIGENEYFTYETYEAANEDMKERCKEFIAFCESKGLSFISEEEVDILIQERAESLGFSEIWDLEKEQRDYFETGESLELEWITLEMPARETDENVEAWKAGYLKALEEYYDGEKGFLDDLECFIYAEWPSECYFSLEDLNNDGRRELLVGKGSSVGNVGMFTYDSDGNIHEAIYEGRMEAYDPNGYIYTESGGLTLTHNVYSFDGINLSPIAQFEVGEYECGYLQYDISNGEANFYNPTEISEEEYNDLMDYYFNEGNFDWREPTDIQFTVENIEDAFDVDISNVYGDWIITAR